MSFFGMTALADGSLETVFKRFKARQLCLKDVTDEQFDALFDKYSVKKQPTLLTHTMNSGRLKVTQARPNRQNHHPPGHLLPPERAQQRIDRPLVTHTPAAPSSAAQRADTRGVGDVNGMHSLTPAGR
jgi:hypothetical protein